MKNEKKKLSFVRAFSFLEGCFYKGVPKFGVSFTCHFFDLFVIFA